MSVDFKCPRCNNEELFTIERRINGLITCSKCGFRGERVHFVKPTMNIPGKIFARSELSCLDDNVYWFYILQLATGVCYRELEDEYGKLQNPDKSLSIEPVNRFLNNNGYKLKTIESKDISIKEVLLTNKDYDGIIIRSLSSHKLEPSIHFYSNHILYTIAKTDDIFKERVLNIWVKNNPLVESKDI